MWCRARESDEMHSAVRRASSVAPSRRGRGLVAAGGRMVLSRRLPGAGAVLPGAAARGRGDAKGGRAVSVALGVALATCVLLLGRSLSGQRAGPSRGKLLAAREVPAVTLSTRAGELLVRVWEPEGDTSASADTEPRGLAVLLHGAAEGTDAEWVPLAPRLAARGLRVVLPLWHSTGGAPPASRPAAEIRKSVQMLVQSMAPPGEAQLCVLGKVRLTRALTTQLFSFWFDCESADDAAVAVLVEELGRKGGSRLRRIL